MSFETAAAYLQKYNMRHRVKIFEVSSATVAQAAQALGCAEELIAKTLAFDVAGKTTLIVAAGDCQIDNHKFKETFHTKAKMLSPADVPAATGHAVGGVCPFGVPDAVDICLDASLKRFEKIYPACGSGNSAVELKIGELEACLPGCRWVDVCRQKK